MSDDVPGEHPSHDDREPAKSGLPTWHPVARIFFYCGTLLLIANLASLVVLAVYLTAQGQAGSLQDRLLEISESPRAELLLGSYGVVGPIAFLWTWFFRRKVDLRSFASLGFPRSRRSSFAIGALIGLLAPGVTAIPALLLGVYRLNPGSADTDSVARGSAVVDAGLGALPVFLLFFIGFVVQSATEELVLRGYVQRNMVEWKAASRNLVWILIVPSLLFSLFHGFNPDYSAVAAVNTVLIGVLFGAIVLANGNLWGAIGLHAGWNFGLGCIWSLPVSGLWTPRLFEIGIENAGAAGFFFGGDYGPEGGIIDTVLVLAGIVWALPRAMNRWLADQWGTQSARVADPHRG